MIILIDNYDSFTFNLHQMIRKLGHDCLVTRNDEHTLEELIKLSPSHLIISPGPGRPEDSGIIIDAIRYFAGKIPVLGVCLGHQAIAQVFGGNVILAPTPYHGKCSHITHDEEGVFKGVSQRSLVARYHSLIVEKESLPRELKITSQNDEGLIMGVRHASLPVVGLQFHPESYATSEGELMMRNFLEGVA